MVLKSRPVIEIYIQSALLNGLRSQRILAMHVQLVLIFVVWIPDSDLSGTIFDGQVI